MKKNSKYLIKINGEEVIKAGNYLMNRGLDVRLNGDYASDIIRVSEI